MSNYFHGTTSDKADSIEEEGLQRGKCGDNFTASTGADECYPVFLTVGKTRAAYWSQQHEITSPNGEQAPAIVKVDGKCLDDTMLTDDPRPTQNRGDKEYAGDIRSDCVTKITPKEGKEQECAKAFEEVEDKQLELDRDNTTLTQFENAVDKFNAACDASYRGGRFV